MCSKPEALLSLHRFTHCWDTGTCICSVLPADILFKLPFLKVLQENRSRVSLSSYLRTYFLVWRLKLYLIPCSRFSEMLLRQFLEINLASSTSLLRVLGRAFIHLSFLHVLLTEWSCFHCKLFLSEIHTAISKSIPVTLKRIITYSLIMNYS